MGDGGKQIKQNEGTWLQSRLDAKGSLQDVKSRRWPYHRASEEWRHTFASSFKSFIWKGILGKLRVSIQVHHQHVVWYGSTHVSFTNLFPHLYKWTRSYPLYQFGSQNWGGLSKIVFTSSCSIHRKFLNATNVVVITVTHKHLMSLW